MEDNQQSTQTASGYEGDDRPDNDGFQSGIGRAARREVNDLRERASGMTDRVVEEGVKAKTTALRLMVDEIDTRKVRLVDGLMSITDAVRDVAERQETPSAMMTQAVRILENATDTLDGHSVQDFGTMITSFSRRNPATFVAGCLLAGLALGRFVTATDATGGSASNGQSGAREREDAPFGTGSSDQSGLQADSLGYPSTAMYEGASDGSA